MDLLTPTDTPSPAQVNAALLILRIASALVFLYHGSAILFDAFGGPGPQGFAAVHAHAGRGRLPGGPGAICRRAGDLKRRADPRCSSASAWP